MNLEKSNFSWKDFKVRRGIYTLLAKVYVSKMKTENPFTQRELICMTEDTLGIRLYENTFRNYIKKENTRKKS